jgi:hypothetical protein
LPGKLIIINVVFYPFLLPDLALIECAGQSLSAENYTGQRNHDQREKDFFHFYSPFMKYSGSIDVIVEKMVTNV